MHHVVATLADALDPAGLSLWYSLDCLDRAGGNVDWQVQEAKQRFSELLRAALSDGPQVVTRHGEEIAVVIDIAYFHQLRGDADDFKEFLRAGPDFDDIDLTRSRDLPRETDWA